MNPYSYIKEATDPDKTLLSLCCGIGLELEFLQTPHIVAVDLSDRVLGTAKLSTTLAFDGGVYLVVAGLVLMVVFYVRAFDLSARIPKNA